MSADERVSWAAYLCVADFFIFTLTLPDRRKTQTETSQRKGETVIREREVKGKGTIILVSLRTKTVSAPVLHRFGFSRDEPESLRPAAQRIREVCDLHLACRNSCRTYPVSGFRLSRPGGCNHCPRIVLLPGKEGKHYIAGLIFSRRKWPHWKSHLWLIIDTQPQSVLITDSVKLLTIFLE